MRFILHKLELLSLDSLLRSFHSTINYLEKFMVQEIRKANIAEETAMQYTKAKEYHLKSHATAATLLSKIKTLVDEATE